MPEGKRKEKLEKELERIVAILAAKYKPQKVILFGSLANGKVKQWSDLDLAIIKETNKKFIKRLKEVALLTDPEVGVDFLVYTPEEFSQMAKDNYFVKDEIINKGKVVYEAK